MEVSCSNNASFNLEAQDIPERVDGEIATSNYFATFGVRPIAGRVFTADEDRPGQAPVVVISERFWRTRLHADPSIIGKPIRVNGLPTTVVGVMPKSFDPLLSNSDLWVPAAFTPAQLADHDNHYLNVMARLKSGSCHAQAQSELELIAQWLQKQYPIDDEDRSFRLQPLANALLGDQRLGLRMMLGGSRVFAADCVREYCEFAVGSLSHAPKRDCHARSAWRFAKPYRAPTSRGKCCARACRRRCRRFARVLGRCLDHLSRSRRNAPTGPIAHRRQYARFCLRRCSSLQFFVWTGSRHPLRFDAPQ